MDRFLMKRTQIFKSEYFHFKYLKNGNLNIFVDAPFVINLYGVNKIAKNPEYIKRSN